MKTEAVIRILAAILENLPTTIAAIAAAWLAFRNARKSDIIAAKADALAVQTAENTAITKATEAATTVLAHKVEITDKKVDVVHGAVEAVNTEARVIAGHVNSSATASSAKIDALQSELLMLRELLSEKKETAALLAQTAARVPMAIEQLATSIAGAVSGGAVPIKVEVTNNTTHDDTGQQTPPSAT